MLGLSHEVESDELRIRARAGRDHDELARTRDPVDSDLADELALRLLHERVARTDDHVDGLHRLGAECERGDRLRTSHPVHLGHLAEDARGEDHRVCPARRGPAGRTRRSRATPATRAVTAPITTVDGYGARPPGT